jgi:broad specificity phosphatase PhoE
MSAQEGSCRTRGGSVSVVYLVRTGRTRLVERGVLQGRIDAPLSEAGHVDAADAATVLAATDVGAVYTSPLRRAVETADRICARVGAGPVVHDGLVDVDAGRWSGTTSETLAANDADAFRSYFRFPIGTVFPGGESMVAVDVRVLAALRSIVAAEGDRTVAVVTHELPIRRVLVRVRRLEGTAVWDPHVPPGSVVELRSTAHGLEVPTKLEDLFRAAARARRPSR